MPSIAKDISVLVANPHSMACELLIGALKRRRNFSVANSVTTAQEVLDAIAAVCPDVVLVAATLADGPSAESECCDRFESTAQM